MEKTLAIIKPDAVERRLIGKIIERLERENITIIAIKTLQITKKEAEAFYYVHQGKPFFESLTEFMSSGPIVVMVLEGDHVIDRYRSIMGATNPKQAEVGSIRHEYGSSIERNACHGSDSSDTASFEIRFFFSDRECLN